MTGHICLTVLNFIAVDLYLIDSSSVTWQETREIGRAKKRFNKNELV